MSNIHRLVKPPSNPLCSKLIPPSLPAEPILQRAAQSRRLRTRATAQAQAHIAKRADNPPGYEDYYHALKTKFIDWLDTASQVQAHEHICHGRSFIQSRPLHTSTSIRSIQCKNRCPLRAQIREYSAAAAFDHGSQQIEWSPVVNPLRIGFSPHAKPNKAMLWLEDRRKAVARKSKVKYYVDNDAFAGSFDSSAIHERLREATWELPGDVDQPSHTGQLWEDTQRGKGSGAQPRSGTAQANDRPRSSTMIALTNPFDLQAHPRSKASGPLDNWSPDMPSTRPPKLENTVAVPTERVINLVARPDRESAATTSQPAAQAGEQELTSDSTATVQHTHADRVHAYPLAPRLAPISDEKSCSFLLKRRVRQPETQAIAARLQALTALIAHEPGHTSVGGIWRQFEALRTPQVQYMSTPLVNRMFSHLAKVEYYHSRDARDRVLSLYHQCLEENVLLYGGSWTTAMMFAGQGSRRVQREHLQDAVEVWLEMEHRGAKAGRITFNVLYYIAAKARRFALADTFLEEVKARGYRIDRYLRCSMIYCAGLRGDGNAVRAKFAEMVHAGEIIDTSVMNCVIKALILAGDGEGAESTFENMKALQVDRFPTDSVKAWQDRRRLAKRADKVRSMIREQQEKHKWSFFGGSYTDKDRLEGLQCLTPVGPDEATYRLIIGYHALVTGDITRIRELMAEMISKGYFHHGSIYQRIFHAFHLHGGRPGTLWSMASLERFWEDFVALLPKESLASSKRVSYIGSRERAPKFFAAAAAEMSKNRKDVQAERKDSHSGSDMHFPEGGELNRQVYFSVAMAKSILRAFFVCCGEHRLIRAWLEICARWTTMSPQENRLLWTFVNDLRGRSRARMLSPRAIK